MTNAEFTTAYLDAMGWKDSVVADENLSVEYPACVYTFSDRRVTALVPEAMCLREEIPEGAALTEVLVCHGKVGLFGGKNPDEEDFAAARKFAQACMNKALNHEI